MTPEDQSWKFPWYLILIFLVLTIGILTTGYLYYKSQESFIKKEKQQELSAIVALKIDQIISWRQERIDYANALMPRQARAAGPNPRTLDLLGFLPISGPGLDRPPG
jgi:hypothetical protein